MALAALVTAAVMVVGAGAAQADGDGGGTAVGEGSNGLFTFAFSVEQGSEDTRDASGDFEAAGVPPSDLLIAPQGPATCVDVRGNTAGFLYPVNEEGRPAVLKGQNILITVVDGGPGGQDFIGFLPTEIDPGTCAPNAAPLPVLSGDIVVEDS
ncbi:hypothetical protein [Pseudonocardia sp. KRD291]|uniref:hypothetical protein n=1 Tax=Pseudonocardia sp. KRD291 TaxID=2792007 RepID=UPI001C4A2A6F|nr:hypothetical protein [Pseudonocardia sp. KRD291]MBW0102779.1 hypothetical protein [Pseudonocardia sp. KRD291]